VRAIDLRPAWQGRTVTVAAWPITRKQVDTHPAPLAGHARPGEPMAFVTVEDETGLIETVWFPRAYRAWGPALDQAQPLLMTGTVQVDHGVVTVVVEKAVGVPLRCG
jgi:hypothetical protein